VYSGHTVYISLQKRSMTMPLDPASLRRGVATLAARDRRLARIVEQHGHPPLFRRPQGFATLAWIILEQQVSLASARALNTRLRTSLGGKVTARGVAALRPEGLRLVGFTRQKSLYVHGLARRVVNRQLNLSRLARMGDEEAATALLDVPGIGPWTAGVYLLMALGRPDVWPPGDLGLHKSMLESGCTRTLPSSLEAAEHALRWRPWRAVAAHVLWHGYLARRGLNSPPA
jgi:DNA-3-methyladenine glycosylase II